MTFCRKITLFYGFLLLALPAVAWQGNGGPVKVTILNELKQAMPGASLQLLTKDSSLLKVQYADKTGLAEFPDITGGPYILRVSHTGYHPQSISLDAIPVTGFTRQVILQPAAASLEEVQVTAKKPFIQFQPDKTVVNVEAGIMNAGSTVMDVLERSPGVTVGRDGMISMKGKAQVMVLIDGKQTQLNGADLQAYLSGLSASQVDVIELIDNPGAKYDAAGNAGIINIKTKKLRQKGFNGSVSLGIGQGIRTKSNNSLNLNYRLGKVNLFLNYGNRLGGEQMNMYALRKYFDQQGRDSLHLDQPNTTRTTITAHNLKTGIDYFLSGKTTLGLVFTGTYNDRNTSSVSDIDWQKPTGAVDSSIHTWGTRNNLFKRSGINLNARHVFNTKEELTADLDLIRFTIEGGQFFQTQKTTAGSPVLATRGNIPSTLDILTAKLDYARRFGNYTWEAGVKTARTQTDNLAEYFYNNGQGWKDDLGRSNHFLYDENIHSLYSSMGGENGRWQWQAGMRYEYTGYTANQLGNSVVKDSAFKRNYGNLFPSLFVTWQADSSHALTFRMGRRIDRPQFQNLNPFIITINKYTFEGGNPFIRPQYTWNFELQHSYKDILQAGISYSYLKDYFSQIFVIDSNSSNINKNVIIYTRGNVGSLESYGASATLQLPVTKGWRITGTAVYTHKIISGFVWEPIRAVVDQLNISLNNQFQFSKGWAAELGGYYQTNSQIDLQETLTPQGELNAGISKQLWKNKATLRFNIRDILYTQNYSGYSRFENSDEPFEVKWDTRVARLSLTWRFGKAMKAIRRSAGGAAEEAERVGTGN